MYPSELHKHSNGFLYRVEVDHKLFPMERVYFGKISFWPVAIPDRADSDYVHDDFMLGVHDEQDGHLIALIRRQDIQLIREVTAE